MISEKRYKEAMSYSAVLFDRRARKYIEIEVGILYNHSGIERRDSKGGKLRGLKRRVKICTHREPKIDSKHVWVVHLILTTEEGRDRRP